jgi:hypothetical protein
MDGTESAICLSPFRKRLEMDSGRGDFSKREAASRLDNGCSGLYMHLALGHFEGNHAVGKGEKREVPSLSDIDARMKTIAFLPDEYGSPGNRLPSETFHATKFWVGIAAIAAAALTDFVRHVALPLLNPVRIAIPGHSRTQQQAAVRLTRRLRR